MSARRACGVADVDVEDRLGVEIADYAGRSVGVVVARDEDGGWHALRDVCSHGKVALSEGEVEGCAIECWLHGSVFDLATGKPLNLPASVPVPVYPVTIEGEDVLVDVDNPLAPTSAS